MMGRLSHDQEQFFYSFRLEEAVSDDHPVREIAAVLDLSWWHSELAPYYSRLGRPSIDPVLMTRPDTIPKHKSRKARIAEASRPAASETTGRDLSRRSRDDPTPPAIIIAQQIKVMEVVRYRAGCAIDKFGAVKQNRAAQCRAFCVRQKKRNLACAALWAIASRQTRWQGSFAHILRAFTR